jgi:DNA-binding CsgD family transcriptional regulator
MLVGRDRELREISEVLERSRSAESATLALVGEPGIGKTALLELAAGLATGMQLLRVRGVESEAEIPFASLLELLRPALGMLDAIPEPQALALEGALALRPAPAQERFAVGAATLSLLAAYAERQPVAVLVDDAHWLDRPSADALLFAVRRLMADPIAVLFAVREGEASLLDGADLPTLSIGGLSHTEAGMLLPGLAGDAVARVHEATAGNPLGMLELVDDADELMLAPKGAPLVVSARISRAFLRRVGELQETEQRALLLAATSEQGDLAMLERAAERLGVKLDVLSAAERLGLVSLRAGSIEFRHPLARSAIYADAPAEQRRAVHRALASVLPDRDVDRRAWHLAAAAAGADDSASAALEQAALRARDRSAYATAGLAFERAGRLAGDGERRARLLRAAAEESWHAGSADRATALLNAARASTADAAILLDIDELLGHIATRRGPVMRGHAMLIAAAQRADPERAVAMLAEAASACFQAGKPTEMLSVAEHASALLPEGASPRSRFLAASAYGMAHVFGGDAAVGAQALQQAVRLAESSRELRDDLQLLPWLAEAPMFLREASTGRPLLEQALEAARAKAAIDVLAFVLNLVALDHATTDRWAIAQATYLEAIALARETGQEADLAFGLSGLARLQARQGRDGECQAKIREAIELSDRLGTRLHEVWAVEAAGMLELGRGEAEQALEQFDRQQQLLDTLSITDPDLSPAPEMIDAHIRLGRLDEAQRLADAFIVTADAKGQPWSRARASRCLGLVAGDDRFAAHFETALRRHDQTPDAYETARTRLAYGQRLRRARDRKLAREQLRAAFDAFERLDAGPWTDRARAELQATGATLRRRTATTVDELTSQELQIALLLAAGKTTRQAATALFLSPKTIEYHLRHVYLKLDIHSREELARAIDAQGPHAEPAGDGSAARP